MEKEYNKKLCEKYPFLLPRNRWTGLVHPDYDYSFTELDSMPTGWKKAFGEQMCEEIKQELEDKGILDKYRMLCWYDFGCTEKMLHEIIPKYEELSKHTCICCGKPATKVTLGWISPYCDECCPMNEYATPIDEYFSKVNKLSFEYN